MAECPRSAPNVHALRSALYRGVGAARARGVVGLDALFEAAVKELDAWAAERPGYRYDRDAAREALLRVAGGPEAALWTDPNPPPDPLPDGLVALVQFAIDRYGTTCMWYAPLDRLAATPRTSWSAVAGMLRENGGPDPRPFWLAQALERAAKVAGDAGGTDD